MMLVVAVNAMIGGIMTIGADAPDVMVVADLRRADVPFIAQNLLTVFAQLAIHGVVATERLMHALNKSVDEQFVIVEIGSLEEFDT